MKEKLIKFTIPFFIIYYIIWVPIGFVFEQHPHMPYSSQLAPFIGFILLLNPNSAEWKNSFSSPYFREIIFPFSIFWCGFIIFFLLFIRIIRNIKLPEK